MIDSSLTTAADKAEETGSGLGATLAAVVGQTSDEDRPADGCFLPPAETESQTATTSVVDTNSNDTTTTDNTSDETKQKRLVRVESVKNWNLSFIEFDHDVKQKDRVRLIWWSVCQAFPDVASAKLHLSQKQLVEADKYITDLCCQEGKCLELSKIKWPSGCPENSKSQGKC